MDPKNTHHAAARVVLEKGIRTNQVSGFAITLHDKYPNAPRPPHRFEMRLAEVGAGNFTSEDMALLARSLLEIGRANNVFTRPCILVGIPNGATALAKAVFRQLNSNESCRATLMPMQKHTTADGRTFSIELHNRPIDYARRRVILIDDLVTSSASKLAAIQALQEQGLQVTDLLVFLDQSVAAQSVLAKHNVQLHASWTGNEITCWGENNGLLEAAAAEAMRQFYSNLAAFMKTAE